jgi:hypothetical protein
MKNKTEIVFDLYNNEIGVLGDWLSDSKVVVKIGEFENVCIISWNKEWLLSLAQHLVSLAQDWAPKGSHFHFDEFNWLEKWSIELIFDKLDD